MTDKEDFENDLTDKNLFKTVREAAHGKQQQDSNLLEDTDKLNENIAPYDARTKKFSCSKCDKTFAQKQHQTDIFMFASTKAYMDYQIPVSLLIKSSQNASMQLDIIKPKQVKNFGNIRGNQLHLHLWLTILL